MHYKANITAGGLLVPESRKITRFLLTYPDKAGWKHAIQTENILQQRSMASAIRIANLIKARLELMAPPIWELIADGNASVSTHAVFATAIKHSRILGNFLDIVVRDQLKRMEEKLSYHLWDEYLEGCKQRDPDMPPIPESTAEKTRNNVFKILYEVGYLSHRRKLTLQRIIIVTEVMEYLKTNQENYVLERIQV